MIKLQIKRFLKLSVNEGVEYDQFYIKPNNVSDNNLTFSHDTTRIFLMKSIENRGIMQGSSIGKPSIDETELGEMIFSACGPQKHDGIASKIHILETSKQILICYVFQEDPNLRKKDYSPNGYSTSSSTSRQSTPGSGKIRMSTSSPYRPSALADLDRSVEDELQSSVNSVSSIASSFAYSLASSMGLYSKGYPSTTPPTCSSSIPTASIYRVPSSTGLRRALSSPSKLAAESVKTHHRKRYLGLGIMFGTNNGQIDFVKLKSFILEKFLFLETQAMVAIKAAQFGDVSIDEIADDYLHYINILSSAKRLQRNMWQTVNLGGLVGSRLEKNSVVEIISDLYNQFESERNFMSTVITSVLAGSSTWHTNICRPYQQIFQFSSNQTRKVIDLYGGIGHNFPVRISFIGNDPNTLQGFLALVSYFQRNVIFIKNVKHNKVKLISCDGNHLSVGEPSCCDIGGTLQDVITSAKLSNSFSLLVEDSGSCGRLSGSDTDQTLTNSSISDSGDEFAKYSPIFTDYALSRMLCDQKLIVSNPNSHPVLSSAYHPSIPIMGLSSTEDVYADLKGGFSAFYESMKLSTMNSEIVPKMIINDTISYDCKIHVHNGNSSKYENIIPSVYIKKVLKNFMSLKQLTGNSKLCLIYLESELETLAYIRDAYLTFCELESSPREHFLNIFGLDTTDQEIFNMYL